MSELTSAIQDSLPEDEKQGSSPVDQEVKTDATVAPSTTPHVETPTPKVEVKETPFHEHPRWKEILHDRDYWKNVAMDAIERAKQVPVAPQQPQDPYAGMDGEAKAFWEQADKRAEAKARALIEAEKKQMEAAITDVKATQMAIIYERFREKHPDIQPNSPEENEIAQKVRMGYTLDDAYTLTMAPKHQQVEIDKAVAKYKAELEKQTKNKQTANLETTAPVVGITPQKKMSVRDFLAAELDKVK